MPWHHRYHHVLTHSFPTRRSPARVAARAVGAAEGADAAVQLAKLAGLLPALFSREAVKDDRQAPHVTPGDVASDVAPDRLRIVSRAHLPIAQSDKIGRAHV